MIICAVCKYWQHGVCFLIMEEEEAPELHVCDICAQVKLLTESVLKITGIGSSLNSFKSEWRNQ